MLYTLHLNNVLCQLYLNKAEERKKKNGPSDHGFHLLLTKYVHNTYVTYLEFSLWYQVEVGERKEYALPGKALAYENLTWRPHHPSSATFSQPWCVPLPESSCPLWLHASWGSAPESL